MPKLVRFLLHHAAVGFLLAIAAVGLMMLGDVARLRTLIMASEVGGLALFMLTFFLGLTLASVQMGVAIVLLGERQDGPGRPRRSLLWPPTLPAKPAPASRVRRR